jgi:DNA-binding beta-propeller fold protein YncE
MSCRLDHDVAVIKREGNEVAARIPAGNHPTGIAILPNGAYAYISDYLGNNVLVARTSDNTIVDTLKFGSVSDWSAVDPNRSEVYIGVPDREQVWVVGYRH